MSIGILVQVSNWVGALNTRLSSTWAAKLDTLNTNYTATRAGYIDNLDAAISTRAAASTALSNATWTSTRAAALDNLTAFSKPTSRPQNAPHIVATIPTELWSSVSRGYSVSYFKNSGAETFWSIDAANLIGAQPAATQTTFLTILDITSGSGVLQFVFNAPGFGPAASAFDATDVKVTIDGNVVVDTSTDTNGRNTRSAGVALVGKHVWQVSPDGAGATGLTGTFEPAAGIPFTSSCKIEMKYVANSGGFRNTLYFAYRRSS